MNRVASGGELSRIMLALKTVLAETDQVPVLVFDEIDTGVGGAVAAAMGTRLRKLGAYHQVFCITHLPQVASQAEHHVIVEKGQDGRRTSTPVRLLRRSFGPRAALASGAPSCGQRFRSAKNSSLT